MLITLFSVLFILGTQNTVYATWHDTKYCANYYKYDECNFNGCKCIGSCTCVSKEQYDCYTNYKNDKEACEKMPYCYWYPTSETSGLCGTIEKACNNLHGETDKCKAYKGCKVNDNYYCNPIYYNIKYWCKHPDETNETLIFTQEYKTPYYNDYETTGKITYGKTFNVALLNDEDLDMPTEDEKADGAYIDVENGCTIPAGYTLAGWYNESEKILFIKTKAYDIPNEYEDYEAIDATSAVTWKYDIVGAILNLYPVWEPTTKSCVPDTDQNGNVKPGTGKYLSKENANCKKCLSGYYCPGVEEVEFDGKNHGLESCPTGSTSDEGAVAITDCFVEPFVTHFTFGNTTFSLPASGKAYYNRPE